MKTKTKKTSQVELSIATPRMMEGFSSLKCLTNQYIFNYIQKMFWKTYVADVQNQIIS